MSGWYDRDVCGATGRCDGLGPSWYGGMGASGGGAWGDLAAGVTGGASYPAGSVFPLSPAAMVEAGPLQAGERAAFVQAELPGTIAYLQRVAASGDAAAIREAVQHHDFGEGYGQGAPAGVSSQLWQQYQQAMQRVMSAAGLSTGAPATTPAPTTQPAEQPSYGPWIVVGVVGVALAGIAAYVATRPRGPTEDDE